jgi:hypothetical protein
MKTMSPFHFDERSGYWYPTFREDSMLTDQEVYESFQELLDEIIKRHATRTETRESNSAPG